jgi:hypothetical protein
MNHTGGAATQISTPQFDRRFFNLITLELRKALGA